MTSSVIPSENDSVSTESKHTSTPQTTTKKEQFSLYEFFRAPGIRYIPEKDFQQGSQSSSNFNDNNKFQAIEEEPNHDNQKCHPNTNIPLPLKMTDTSERYEEWSKMSYMQPKLYGYRLGDYDEIKVFEKKLNKQVRPACVACSICCFGK